MVFSAGGKKRAWQRKKWVITFIFQASDKVSDQFGLLPSGGWAGLQWEATWLWIQHHLRQHPQAVLSSTRHRSLLAACKSTAHVDKYQIFPHRDFKAMWTLHPPLLSLDHRREARLPTHQWTSHPEVRVVWATVQMCGAHGRFNFPICWWEFFTLSAFINF